MKNLGSPLKILRSANCNENMGSLKKKFGVSNEKYTVANKNLDISN